ncbi:MAG: hypothetical protein D6788_02815 [Planctomycetota bacterium]|nr:MAG: hypothetical protein D6788_02815 [Planctomycetota bacterium]
MVWWGSRKPPGEWKPGYGDEEIRIGWEKEKSWAHQTFTPIRDDSAFREAVGNIAVRLQEAVDPKQVDQLREILYNQLVCRHSGSIECYRERFIIPYGAPEKGLDEFRREWVERIYSLVFGRQLPPGWEEDAESVFEEFWKQEYGDGAHRFKEVALGPKGSLIVIGRVQSAFPDSFFTPEELRHWKSWPGASRRRSVEFHIGGRSLEEIVNKVGFCIYAETAMIVRSFNGDVWCWATDWYLDPEDRRWRIHQSVAVTLRGPYHCPL